MNCEYCNGKIDWTKPLKTYSTELILCKKCGENYHKGVISYSELYRDLHNKEHKIRDKVWGKNGENLKNK